MLVNQIYFRQNSFPDTDEFSFSIHTMPCSEVIGGPIDSGFTSACGDIKGLGGPSKAGRGPSLESVNCASKPRLSAGRTRCS